MVLFVDEIEMRKCFELVVPVKKLKGRLDTGNGRIFLLDFVLITKPNYDRKILFMTDLHVVYVVVKN